MAKASVSIAISGSYNGSAIAKAEEDMRRLRVTTASEMGGAAGAITSFGTELGNAGGMIHDMGYKMESVGDAATRNITLPIAAAATAVGMAAVDIDTSLTGVKKTVDGTEEQYQQLKEAAIEFSRTNAVSATQILDVQALGAQLGFAIDELDEFAQVTTGLDIATNMDAETAASEMAHFANIMKMGHDEVRNYGSAIVGLGNNFATTESDISHMAIRLAAAGAQVGMSEADVLGLATAMSSLGVEAEAGGTAISTIMASIDKTVARGTAGLEQYAEQAGMSTSAFITAMSEDANQFKALAEANGMSLKGLKGETVDALESMTDWADAAGMSAEQFASAWLDNPVEALGAVLSGMEAATAEGGNMSLMLEELGIKGIRQTDVLKRMAGNSELVAEAVGKSNEEWEKNTALQNEVDNRNASMAAQFEILKNRVIAVAEQVGTPLVNAAIEFVDAAEPVLNVVEDAAEAFSEMDEQDQRMIVGLLAGAAAFGPVVGGAGKMFKVVGDLTAGMGKGVQTMGGWIGQVKQSGIAATAAQAGIGALDKAMKLTGVGLGIAVTAELVAQFASYVEHEKLVEDATDGLTSAFESAAAAGEDSASGVEAMSSAIQGTAMSAEECLRAQADLASGIRETWGDAQADIAMVDSYTATIERLAGKSSLTAQEQQELALAVEGYSEATGDSIEVINSQTGELSKSTDEILANAEAWKKQAEAEALREIYKDALKQQYENTLALSEAQRELNGAAEGWGLWIGDFPVIADEASVKYHELQQNVDDLSAAQEANAETQKQVVSMMAAASDSFSSLDEALEFTGTKMADFGSLTDYQLTMLQEDFDGSLKSIVRSCSDHGVSIPPTLAASMGQDTSSLDLAAFNIGSAINAGIERGLVEGDSSTRASVESTANGVLDTFRTIFDTHSPSKVTEQMGRDLDAGLKIGIEGSSEEPGGAMESLGNLLRGRIAGLPEDARGVGSRAGSGLAGGLSSASGSVSGSALSLAATARGGIAGAPGDFRSTGSSAAASFGSAIRGTSAYSSGQGLASTAREGMRSVSADGAGRDFARGFAGGMGGVDIWGAAYSVGRSALGAIKSALGIASPSKEAMAVGEFFGEGAIIGMDKTVSAIEAEAEKMSRAMELNPELPEFGPGDGGAGPWAAPAARYAAPGAYAQPGDQRPIVLNVTINVTAKSEDEARRTGMSVGQGLYEELERLNRAQGRDRSMTL